MSYAGQNGELTELSSLDPSVCRNLYQISKSLERYR